MHNIICIDFGDKILAAVKIMNDLNQTSENEDLIDKTYDDLRNVFTTEVDAFINGAHLKLLSLDIHSYDTTIAINAYHDSEKYIYDAIKTLYDKLMGNLEYDDLLSDDLYHYLCTKFEEYLIKMAAIAKTTVGKVMYNRLMG